MTNEILELRERRESKNDESRYRELDNEIKHECDLAKEEWLSTECEEIEKL